jgi:SPP1 family predicted phage head-tail adaptor
MNSQDYDQRITLQVPSMTKSLAGGFKQEWVDLVTVWASRIDFPEVEKSQTKQAGGVGQAGRTEFRINFRTGVDAGMRLIHKGQVFDVAHVNDTRQRHQQLVLTCQIGSVHA